MRNDTPPDNQQPRRRRSTSLASRQLPPPPTNNTPPPIANAIAPIAPVFERFHNFKEFIALQKDSLEPERAVQLYAQYQMDFKVQAAKMQFEQNIGVGYVRERFHPDNIVATAHQKMALARKTAKIIIESIRNNLLLDICLEINITDPQSFLTLVKRDISNTEGGRVIGVIEDIDKFKSESSSGRITDSPFYAININDGGRTLILKKLPADVQRVDLEEILSEVQGVESITLLPSCLVSENYSKLMICAGEADPDDLSPESLEQAISECYTKSRGPYGQLFPLQTAWIEFDTRENCEKAELAIEKLPIRDLCTAHPMKVNENSMAMRKIRVCALDTADIRNKDCILLQKLIIKLDREFKVYEELHDAPSAKPIPMVESTTEPMVEDGAAGAPAIKEAEDDEIKEPEEVKEDDPLHADLIDDSNLAESAVTNPFLFAIKDLTSTHTQMDLMILYLRAVHAMDYYSGKICWSQRELFETCGALTVRINQASDVLLVGDEMLLKAGDQNAFRKQISAILSMNFVHWMRPIDEEHPIFVDLWSRFCVEKTMPVDTEKYRCGMCRKAFKGAEFVHKHLKNKHSIDEGEPLKQKSRMILMRQAFENEGSKLLLFAIPITFETTYRTGPSARNNTGSTGKSPGEFGPQRRGRVSGSARSGPMSGTQQRSTPEARLYRDWDAPRSRLQDRFGAGTFRTLIRYNDL